MPLYPRYNPALSSTQSPRPPSGGRRRQSAVLTQSRRRQSVHAPAEALDFTTAAGSTRKPTLSVRSDQRGAPSKAHIVIKQQPKGKQEYTLYVARVWG